MHGPFTPQFSITLPREEWMALPLETETCPGHIMIMSHLPSVKKKKNLHMSKSSSFISLKPRAVTRTQQTFSGY